MKLAAILATTAVNFAAAESAPAPPPGMVPVPADSYVPLIVQKSQPRPVAACWMDARLVTNGEFLEFVRLHPQWRRSAVKEIFADKLYLRHWGGDLDLGPSAEEAKTAPVTNVSWFAARAYLAWQGKRLPTMDEWEMAARADATKRDASQDPAFSQQLLDWYARPTPHLLPSVDSVPANFFGLRGMHGVVWEWVEDFNNAMDTGEGRSGGTLERDLFCAGGSVNSPDKSNYAAFMRFAFRSSLRANYALGNLGFRGALSPGQKITQSTPASQVAGTALELPSDSIYHTPGVWKNQRGEAAPLRSLRGKIQVLAMGYTTCKYACPRITADLRAIERQLGAAAGPMVGFCFASFDSERDTSEVLSQHALKSGLDHWQFLTSDPPIVRQLAATLGVKFEKMDADYAHSNIIYVLNRDGQIIHRQEGLGGPPTAAIDAIRKSLTSP